MENKEHYTNEDLAAHVDRVIKALKKTGTTDLVALVERLTSITKVNYRETCPFGLIKDPENGIVEIQMQPDVGCKLTHMVLSPETAKSYDLEYFVISNVHQFQGGNPIPLEPFSIEYMQDDRLASCMKWETVTLGPGNRFTIIAKLRKGFEPVQFRGILWAKMKVGF
jgi:hypothetical protein